MCGGWWGVERPQFVGLSCTAHDDFSVVEYIELFFGEVCGASCVTQLSDGEEGSACEFVKYMGLCCGLWQVGDVKVAGVG